ncbi:MAG: hypothetical protein RLZZ303_3024 [Candidatus Hydrogenedentota bacterium]
MDIQEQLRELGVRSGDLLMLHASMRRIGPVPGGARGLIGQIEEVVTPSGTLLMVLGAENGWDEINQRPEAERAALLALAPPFDPLRTPAYHEVGVLAEQFRQMQGTLVSNNPEGRFAARGGRAEEILSNAPWDDYYGPGSPLEKLCKWGGRILRMGADTNTITALHYAEYLCSLPGKRRVCRHGNVGSPGNPVIKTVSCLDDEHGIFEWKGEDYFADLTEEYLSLGRARTGRVGHANSELIEAADIVEFGRQWMDEHLGVAS